MNARYFPAILLFFSTHLMGQSLCDDPEQFAQFGWQESQVQTAMDRYMREHRMRANWLNQPSPPDQIGRNYYEWLWSNNFGAAMKRELTGRFCGFSQNSIPEE